MDLTHLKLKTIWKWITRIGQLIINMPPKKIKKRLKLILLRRTRYKMQRQKVFYKRIKCRATSKVNSSRVRVFKNLTWFQLSFTKIICSIRRNLIRLKPAILDLTKNLNKKLMSNANN